MTGNSLTLTAVDLAQRPIRTDVGSLAIKTPAALSLSPLTVTSPLVAGGTGAVTVYGNEPVNFDLGTGLGRNHRVTS